MPDSSSLLQISHFSKNFRDFPALSNVSFSINQGEILGLIGPNGSGKTTLLEGIAGFLPLNSGAVSYLGCALKDNKRRNHLFSPIPHVQIIVELSSWILPVNMFISKSWLITKKRKYI